MAITGSTPKKRMIDNYVTGASGFIGSHLLKRLEGQSNDCIQNDEIVFATHKPKGRRLFLLSTYGNLAHQTDWRETVKANVFDLGDLIELCQTTVFTSSSSVNLSVQTAYSRCKKAAEEILLTLPEWYRPIIIRPFSVTGVGEQKEHLIPKLIHSCFSGEEMPFAPDATHDWIDVEDVVDGMLLLSEKAERGVFELGNGFARSNKFVRGVVEAVTGHKANCVPWEGRAYDNSEWYCRDIAARQIGWTPKRTLLDSIEGMVEDYLKNEPAKTQVC